MLEGVSKLLRDRLVNKGSLQRSVAGSVVALFGLALLVLLLLPFRDHLSTAIPALTFVVPVILGVVVGGIAAGIAGSIVGFLLFDYFFLPPYGQLTVQSAQNWIALLVYVVVVLVVAQVVVRLRAAREEAQRRTEDSDRLFELSQALIGDLTLSQLLTHIVTTVQTAFSPRWTALVLPDDQGDAGEARVDLRVAASAGQELAPADVASLTSSDGQIRSLGLIGGEKPSRAALALVVSNRPVGMLVLQDVRFAGRDRSLLGIFANQAALAVDRAQLREQALRSRLLEEIDVWRRALMGAVSHDLRTPLASIKTAVSSLRQSGAMLGPDDRAELLELIELQSDRLARLVTNLLDMTRIESGALEIRPIVISFDDVVGEALDSLGGLVPTGRVATEAPEDLPLLNIDHVLIAQVLANLLENAERHSPSESTILVSARLLADRHPPLVEISVADDGPGIASEERERVFEMFSQNGGGGRAGIGLAIAKAFVEAHGGAIRVEPTPGAGARLVFGVPAESAVPSHA
jgi:two-component system sensor histidine kinase KdpD